MARLSSMSIAANIVEGRGQESQKEFARYLKIAINSASETEYHLITARDIGAISRIAFSSLMAKLIEVRKMLHGLLTHVRKKPTNPKADRCLADRWQIQSF